MFTNLVKSVDVTKIDIFKNTIFPEFSEEYNLPITLFFFPHETSLKLN